MIKKCLFIDCENQDITEVETDTLQDCYDLIGNECNLVECGVYLDNDDVIYVDEEGLYNPHKFGFTYKNTPYIGNGIVIGTNIKTGNSVHCKSTKEEILDDIDFIVVNRRD